LSAQDIEKLAEKLPHGIIGVLVGSIHFHMSRDTIGKVSWFMQPYTLVQISCQPAAAEGKNANTLIG
jgi:hypothetical protein